MQETSFITVDSELVNKHASKPNAKLTANTNSTKTGAVDLDGYQSDGHDLEPSGYIKDLAVRYTSNDEALIAAYKSLYRYGINDRTSLDNIEAIKGSNKRIESAIFEVS